MGFAAPVIGAIGVVTQMSQASRQAAAQREQIRAQQLASEHQYRLEQQRFQYAKSNAAALYQREAVLAEDMRQRAYQQLDSANIQQDITDIYRKNEELQFAQSIKAKANQLLATAATARGQGAMQAGDLYNKAVQMFKGNEMQANQFIQRLVATNQKPNEALNSRFLLDALAMYQDALTTGNTAERVSGFQADAMTSEADITEKYGNIATQFLDVQNKINNDFRNIYNKSMPSILELDHQRNMTALETASYARQAELSMGLEASGIQQQLSSATSRAQMSGIPSTGSILLGGLTGIASQTIPFILSRAPQQSGSVFPAGSYGGGFPVGGYTFGSRSATPNPSPGGINVPNSNFFQIPQLMDIPVNRYA